MVQILIIDDENLLRQTSARVLVKAGYQVCEAATGAEGLRLAQEHRPDLILLDVVLPDGDGIDICRQIKADPRTATCFVVLLSGIKVGPDFQVQGRAAGADDYITRPIENRELLARLQTMVRLKQTQDALRESEQRLRYITRSTPAYIYEIDANGVIQFANKPFEGFTDEQVIGTPLTDWITVELRPTVAELIAHIFFTGEAQALECTFPNPQGKPNTYMTQFTLAVNDHVPMVILTATDITEHKLVETLLARRIRQLGLLNDIGGKIASILDQESLWTRAVQLVQAGFGYHHVALFTMEPDHDRVVMRARAGAFTQLFAPGHSLKLGQGMVGWVARYGKTILANDVNTEPRYVNLYPEILPTRSELSVPIRIGADIVGVLDVQSPQCNAFDGNDVRVIQTLADQLAIALDNARLFAKAERLTALNEGIVKAVPDAIVIVDTEGEIKFANEALTALLGYPREDVVGQHWENFIPQEQHALVLAADAQNLQGYLQRCELTLLTQEGRAIPVLYSSTPWVDTEAGHITGTLVVFTDIRETKKAEEELQKSMARYRAVVDYQTDLICRFQPDGVLTFVNLTYCRYFGKEREALIGHSFFPLVVAEDREKTLHHLAAFGPEKLVATTERRVNAAGGKLRWQQWIDRPIFDEAGHLIEFQSVGRDITEQKQQELELQKHREHLEELVETRTAELRASREHLSRMNAELTRAARLKDEFLASMSHELRTPLTSILGMSEVLSEQVFGPLTEQQARAAQTITASGQHLLALINDILDVSKIEAGKLELNLGAVEVEAVCESALYMVRQAAHKKDLTVITHFEQPELTLVADHRRLKQILVNLLSNATKFTPEGGSIGINVVQDEEKQIINFIVWDTGIGIAEDDMARLFQPFVQLDSRLAREYNGSGLGLALVYRLAQMHGGCVSLESQLGQGSRFTVSLPYRKPQEESVPLPVNADPEPQRNPNSAKSPTARGQILLADDNEDTINTISKYLQVKGYGVITARNGYEAVNIAHEAKPDLVLMDVQMPRMDGLEAIRRIRADTELQAIPIIALTALAMPGDRECCLETGANAYMSKPISLRSLVKTIETHLECTRFVE